MFFHCFIQREKKKGKKLLLTREFHILHQMLQMMASSIAGAYSLWAATHIKKRRETAAKG